MSFSTLGDWDKRTLDYFRNVAEAMAGNNRKEAGKIFGRIRERIAVAIIVGQGQVVREVNRRNSMGRSSVIHSRYLGGF